MTETITAAEYKALTRKSKSCNFCSGDHSESSLECRFAFEWERHSPNEWNQPTPQHRFDPQRRSRFDFAWTDYTVAVELDGGTWSGGRHTRGAGFASDCEKINRAIEQGWVVLRYTSDMLTNDPVSVIEQIGAVLKLRGMPS